MVFVSANVHRPSELFPKRPNFSESGIRNPTFLVPARPGNGALPEGIRCQVTGQGKRKKAKVESGEWRVARAEKLKVER